MEVDSYLRLEITKKMLLFFHLLVQIPSNCTEFSWNHTDNSHELTDIINFIHIVLFISLKWARAPIYLLALINIVNVYIWEILIFDKTHFECHEFLLLILWFRIGTK